LASWLGALGQSVDKWPGSYLRVVEAERDE
jgi:hypothetical protein